MKDNQNYLKPLRRVLRESLPVAIGLLLHWATDGYLDARLTVKIIKSAFHGLTSR